MEIFCHPWTVLHMCTAQEDHGSGKRLVRVRFELRQATYLSALFLLGIAFAEAGIYYRLIGLGAASVLVLAGVLGIWWRGRALAGQAIRAVDRLAGGMGLLRCEPTPKATKTERLVGG